MQSALRHYAHTVESEIARYTREVPDSALRE